MESLLTSISKSRLTLYLIAIGMLPIIFIAMQIFSDHSRLNTLGNALNSIEYSALLYQKKQAQNLAIKDYFHDADHFYIDKHIETLQFLEPETTSLQKIVSQPNFVENEAIRKRLEFLSSGNSLSFSEGVVQTFPYFQEVIESQIHPVEVNGTDIQKILAKIEGINIGPFTPGPHRPQLLILEFKLDKKKVTENNEVFSLNMKLLKREFL